jgi:hypothetical protein
VRLALAALVAFAMPPGLALAVQPSLDPYQPGPAINDWPCWPDSPCPLLTVDLSSSDGSGIWETTNVTGTTPNGLISCRFLNGVATQGSTCSHRYFTTGYPENMTISYRMTPDPGSRQCTVNGGAYECAATAYVASFVMPTSADYLWGMSVFYLLNYPVTVTTSGAGSGHVTSTPPLINCPSTCSDGFLFGTTVDLTATPDAGAYFAGWTGRCAGQPAVCGLVVELTGNTTNAVFGFGSPPPTSAPTVKPSTSPRPTARTATPAPSKPATTPGSTGPASTTGPGASAATAQTSPTVSIEPEASPTAAPVDPISTGSDSTPIVLAILGAGLLIAIGLGFLGFSMRKRSR